MSNLEDVNKWAAEQVGVVFTQTWRGRVWSLDNSGEQLHEWTIEDARCREVFRKWWIGDSKFRDVIFDCTHVHYFDSITEDALSAYEYIETACITKLYEASHGR